MKKCFKCNIEKSISDFYAHKQMKDGHLNKCKECTKIDVRADRINSPNARIHDRKRFKENESRYNKHLIRMKKYRNDNPEKYKAHGILNRAIRAGKIARQNCSICSKKAHAHHEDYSKPLEVVWLCSIHHSQKHHQQEK